METGTQIRTLKVPRIQYREFTVIGRGDVIVEESTDDTPEVRKYPLTLSSEQPVRRYDWWNDEYYYEVLSHENADVDLSVAEAGLPLLKSHTRLLHSGSIEDVEIDAQRKVLRGNARFASTQLGTDEETMVREGHTKRVSVGYEILGYDLLSRDEETGIATYLTRWRPLEGSTEPLPADQTVGFGRARPQDGPDEKKTARAEEGIEFVEIAVEEGEERQAEPLAKGERSMGQELKQAGAPGTPETPIAGGGEERGMPARERNAEVADILEMCEAHGVGDRAAGWIREGLSVERIQREILGIVKTRGGVAQPPAESLDLSAREARSYSYQRAIRIAAGMDRREGFEAEIHDELAKRGSGPQHNGILVPLRLRDAQEPTEYGRRTLGITEPGTGSVVGTQRLEFIDILRKKARCLEFGARFLPGLTGVVMMPKKTGEATVQWMEENPAADATATEPEYGYVLMAPKTMIGTVPIPRQVLAVQSFDVEADITNDLALGTSHALDLAAIHGTGTNKQPAGIYSAADVQSKAMGGVPSYPKLAAMVGQVADEDADFGALAWMTTPLMAAKLLATVIESGYPKFIWDGKVADGTMVGYRAGATNQVSKTLGSGADEHGLIFGNWNELVIGMWGNEVELVVDVTSKAKKGIIDVTSFAMGDVAIRHPEAFVKATGAKTA